MADAHRRTITCISRDWDAQDGGPVTVRWVDDLGDPYFTVLDNVGPELGWLVERLMSVVYRTPDGALVDIDALLLGHGEESPGHMYHPFCPRCSANWEVNATSLEYEVPDPAPYVDILPERV